MQGMPVVALVWLFRMPLVPVSRPTTSVLPHCINGRANLDLHPHVTNWLGGVRKDEEFPKIQSERLPSFNAPATPEMPVHVAVGASDMKRAPEFQRMCGGPWSCIVVRVTATMATGAIE